MNQKPADAGWFYHAPAPKEKNSEPVGAPPPSQIPGLGDITVPPREKPKEMVFYDSDSDYIRMAKMGGRKDLLAFRPNSGQKKEAKSYPRNDWFYLEDNAKEEKAREKKDQQPWKFLLPDYMVYQSYGKTTLQEEDPGVFKDDLSKQNDPHASGDQSQFARNEILTTDNSVISPKTGQPSSGGCKAVGRRGRPIKLCPRALDKSPKLKYQPLPAEPGEPTSMTKILSYSYEREWHDRLQKWQEKQVELHEASMNDYKQAGRATALDKTIQNKSSRNIQNSGR